MKWVNGLLCRAIVFVVVASDSLSRIVHPVTYSYQITNGEETYTSPYRHYGIRPNLLARQTDTTFDEYVSPCANASLSTHPSILSHHYYDRSSKDNETASSYLQNKILKHSPLQMTKTSKAKKNDNYARTEEANEIETTTFEYEKNNKSKSTELPMRKVRIWKKVGTFKKSRNEIPVNEETQTTETRSKHNNIKVNGTRFKYNNRNLPDKNKTTSSNVSKIQVNQITENSQPLFDISSEENLIHNDAEFDDENESNDNDRSAETANVMKSLKSSASGINSSLQRSKSASSRQRNNESKGQVNDNEITNVNKSPPITRFTKKINNRTNTTDKNDKKSFTVSPRNVIAHFRPKNETYNGSDDVKYQSSEVYDEDDDNVDNEDNEDDNRNKSLKGNSNNSRRKLAKNEIVTPLPKYKELYLKRPAKKGQDRTVNSRTNSSKGGRLMNNLNRRYGNESVKYAERSTTLKIDLMPREMYLNETDNIKDEQKYEPGIYNQLFKNRDLQKMDAANEHMYVVKEPEADNENEPNYNQEDTQIGREDGREEEEGEEKEKVDEGDEIKEREMKNQDNVHLMKMLHKPLQYEYVSDQSETSVQENGHKSIKDDKNNDGGEKHRTNHQESEGKKADKGYKSRYVYENAKKGHSDKEKRTKDDHEEESKKKKHKEEGGHYGEQHVEAEGKKEALFGESGNHKKGHSTKGRFNIYVYFLINEHFYSV